MECSISSSLVVQILPPCFMLLDFNLYSFPFYYVLFFSLSVKSNTGCQSCLSQWTSPWMSPTVSSCRIIKAFFWLGWSGGGSPFLSILNESHLWPSCGLMWSWCFWLWLNSSSDLRVSNASIIVIVLLWTTGFYTTISCLSPSSYQCQKALKSGSKIK